MTAPLRVLMREPFCFWRVAIASTAFNDRGCDGEFCNSLTLHHLFSAQITNLMAGSQRTHTNGINTAGGLSVGGFGLVVSLNAGTSGVHTVLVGQSSLVKCLSRTAMSGDPVLVREIVEFASGLSDQCFHDWFGQSLVWKAVTGGLNSLLDCAIISFSFWNVGLGWGHSP